MSSTPHSPVTVPEATQSDPAALGIMQGFPPAPDKAVSFADGSLWRFPLTRWAFSHQRELLPTKAVSRGRGPVTELPRAERDLATLGFKTMDGTSTAIAAMLDATYADGFIVLHRGCVVFERYFGALSDAREHVAMSVTKSFVGTIAAMLAHDGKIDPAKTVADYLPELGATAFADATVRQVMDMTTGVKYSEDYANPAAEIWQYAVAANAAPAPADYRGPRTLYSFLATMRKEGAHDVAFAYKTINTEVLAWIAKRVTGRSLAELLSSLIWAHLGAEADAYFGVDPVGTEIGGGGLNTTLRDLARFGEMMRNNGRADGRQVVSEAVVADIGRGGDKAKFAKAGYETLAGWSYRNMWWVSHNAHGAYMARGIHGQSLYIDPAAEMVIVRYASHPVATNVANDALTLPAFAAIADHLMEFG